MDLQHIDLANLNVAAVNVRKAGARAVDDLLPSIRRHGILQPLLVRADGAGFEIVAGQRRFYALQALRDEGITDPVPCIVMESGDDAVAIEASLAENIARLPMDEIDQYKAFAALVKEGQTPEDIAARFGVTERLVHQRLAVANIITPILNAYRREELHPGTLRILTMATKRQQKAWWDMLRDDTQRAPEGHALKNWLFGGANIPTGNALFDLDAYGSGIVTDLFGDTQYFNDSARFWTLQNKAVAEARDRYLAAGWAEVVILNIGEYFASYEYVDTAKEAGGKIFVRLSHDGEVSFFEGLLSQKEVARRRKAAEQGGAAGSDKPELTKSMQRYLDLHRHAAVRGELLGHQGLTLRLAVAQMIAGSALWEVRADPQKAPSDAIAESLSRNRAEDQFAAERAEVFALLGMEGRNDETLALKAHDWMVTRDLHAILAQLIALDDAAVHRIMAFVVAETLPCGSALVEGLGVSLNVDMADHWTPDEVFFDLLRDKSAINAMLAEAGGKPCADANIAATGKLQKSIIQECLDGIREPATPNWQPRYMTFPMGQYSQTGDLSARVRWDKIVAHYS